LSGWLCVSFVFRLCFICVPIVVSHSLETLRIKGTTAKAGEKCIKRSLTFLYTAFSYKILFSHQK